MFRKDPSVTFWGSNHHQKTSHQSHTHSTQFYKRDSTPCTNVWLLTGLRPADSHNKLQEISTNHNKLQQTVRNHSCLYRFVSFFNFFFWHGTVKECPTTYTNFRQRPNYTSGRTIYNARQATNDQPKFGNKWGLEDDSLVSRVCFHFEGVPISGKRPASFSNIVASAEKPQQVG